MVHRPAGVRLVGVEQQKREVPDHRRDLDPRAAMRAPARGAVELERAQRPRRSVLELAHVFHKRAPLRMRIIR